MDDVASAESRAAISAAVGSFGPFNPDHAWKLRDRLIDWCETADLGFVVGAVDVCEAIIPAIDALLDLYAGNHRAAVE